MSNVQVLDLHKTKDRFNSNVQATVQGAWECTIVDSNGNSHHGVAVAQLWQSEANAMREAKAIATQYDFS